MLTSWQQENSPWFSHLLIIQVFVPPAIEAAGFLQIVLQKSCQLEGSSIKHCPARFVFTELADCFF